MVEGNIEIKREHCSKPRVTYSIGGLFNNLVRLGAYKVGLISTRPGDVFDPRRFDTKKSVDIKKTGLRGIRITSNEYDPTKATHTKRDYLIVLENRSDRKYLMHALARKSNTYKALSYYHCLKRQDILENIIHDAEVSKMLDVARNPYRKTKSRFSFGLT